MNKDLCKLISNKDLPIYLQQKGHENLLICHQEYL